MQYSHGIILGLIQGLAEFLPISSTGHLILVEELVHLDQPEDFFNVFKEKSYSC